MDGSKRTRRQCAHRRSEERNRGGDSVYRAKIAEKELFLKDQIRKAQLVGKIEETRIAGEATRLGNPSITGRVRSGKKNCARIRKKFVGQAAPLAIAI